MVLESFLEYLRLCLYLEVKTWLQWFTLFIIGVLKLLKIELLLLFLSWQVRYWYIRNLLVLYVDFCVLLLCWKFSESAHRDNFTSTFVICTFSFHSALGKNSRTMVSKNGEKGHPSLLPDLRRCFLSHVISHWLEACQIWSLLSWCMLLLFQVFWGDFYHGRILDFVKGFFCICWNDPVISVLGPIYMLYCIYRFACMEPTLHP